MASHPVTSTVIRAHVTSRKCMLCQGSLRYFNSSPSATTQIAPESPKFIEIPRLVQPHARPQPYIKGVLPVPRQVFPRGSKDKTTADYLAAVTPEPTSKKNLDSTDTSAAGYIEWKARLAATRRKNLREGLVELQYRKQKIDRHVAARSAFRRAEHERLVHQPEREDERLTNPSVTQEMTPGHVGRLLDPNRKARVARKRANVEAKEEGRWEERRNALHSLYMNARDFIVTEAELNKKVDEAFDDEFFQNGASIWDKYSQHAPETIQHMLNEANKTGNRAISYNQGYAGIDRQRVQRIAEELTGGKM
ncbi:hypothetical protein MMC24_005240 [Lignoscripta atroalba]|nr:hypothetical protein [Lignoscripta atroalba]